MALSFDARTGERLDPLPDSILLRWAEEELVGTRARKAHPVKEPNRYYAADRVPAALVLMEGEHPTQLLLSRDEGRVPRRSDRAAQRFTWWYQVPHVFQWSDHHLLWTGVLYLLAGGTVALDVLGLVLFWRRRGTPVPSVHRPGRRSRRWHRILGVTAGTVP